MHSIVSTVLTVLTVLTVPAGAYSCYHYRLNVYSPANAKLVHPNEGFYMPDLGPVVIIAGGERWELVEVRLR